LEKGRGGRKKIETGFLADAEFLHERAKYRTLVSGGGVQQIPRGMGRGGGDQRKKGEKRKGPRGGVKTPRKNCGSKTKWKEEVVLRI